MAEFIGLVASITALIQVSSQVSKYVRDVKDATRECKKIGLEVSSLHGILEALKDTVEEIEGSGDWHATFQTLESPGNPIETLTLVLEPLRLKLEKEASAKGFKKLTKSLLWPLNVQATSDVLQAVERQKTLLLIALENDHIQLSAEIRNYASSTAATVNQMLHVIEAVRSSQRDEQVSRALTWLSNLNYDTTQNDVHRQRYPGTGNWFLETREFQSWLRGEQKTLQCHGIPGAGKTVISSTVVQHLQDMHKDQRKDVAIAWVYCNLKARDAQTTAAVLGSIAMQTSRYNQTACEFVTSLHQSAYRAPGASATTEESILVLQKMTDACSRVFVVVDALDEYSSQDDAARPFIEILRRLEPAISLMVTSRPLPSIMRYFTTTNAGHIQISAQEQDVRAFVQVRMQQAVFRKHLQNDEPLKKRIENALAEKSQGMFLLTKLHAESLQEKAKYSKAELRRAVDALPEKLDDAYGEALQRIDTQNSGDARLARQVISWVMYTFEAISPRILQQGISKQRLEDPRDTESWVDPDVLVDVCAGLVVIHEESETIRLVHYTTREYLSRHFQAFHPSGKAEFNYTCLHHALSLPILRQADGWGRLGPSIGIVHYWQNMVRNREKQQSQSGASALSEYVERHISRSYNNNLRHSLVEWPLRTRSTEKHFQIMDSRLQLMIGESAPKQGDIDDLRMAVFFNLHSEVSRILGLSNELTLSEDIKSRSLCLAAVMGSDEIVQLLLNAGADASAAYPVHTLQSPPPECNSAEWALIDGNKSTVELITSRCPGLIVRRVKTTANGSVELEGETS